MSSRSPMLCCDEPWPEPIRTRYRKCSYRLANTVQDGAGKARSKHVRASRIALIPQQHAATNHLIAPVNSQCEKCGLARISHTFGLVGGRCPKLVLISVYYGRSGMIAAKTVCFSTYLAYRGPQAVSASRSRQNCNATSDL